LLRVGRESQSKRETQSRRERMSSKYVKSSHRRATKGDKFTTSLKTFARQVMAWKDHLGTEQTAKVGRWLESKGMDVDLSVCKPVPAQAQAEVRRLERQCFGRRAEA
jgi:hypothetical protein